MAVDQEFVQRPTQMQEAPTDSDGSHQQEFACGYRMEHIQRSFRSGLGPLTRERMTEDICDDVKTALGNPSASSVLTANERLAERGITPTVQTEEFALSNAMMRTVDRVLSPTPGRNWLEDEKVSMGAQGAFVDAQKTLVPLVRKYLALPEEARTPEKMKLLRPRISAFVTRLEKVGIEVDPELRKLSQESFWGRLSPWK